MRRIACSLALACATLGPPAIPSVHAQSSAEAVPQPTLPIVRLQAGIHIIRAELANNDRTRAIGLMGRRALGPNEGMLFVFERKAVHCFWMRNTPLPLSIAFLDDDGRIVDIAQMAPRSDDSHCPSREVRFALEMEQGWFARHGLAPGARLVQPSIFPGQR
ncbi:MAG: DUF192 domain-containing protein [Burkholderiaceae bacterium]|nr:DUF192 domain-containing protein [Burkholderiaceae bacterium]